MKYHIITYGCQMNESDSERLATVLEKNNYQKTEKIEKADLVAIVSCSVRQMAIDRVYGAIRNIRKENKKTKIIITGCLPEKDKKKLAKEVDLIFEIKNLNKLPKLLEIRNLKLKIGEYLGIKPKYSTFPVAYVPIMTGCDNFCTYCVVPYTRGPEVSRNASDILQEVRELIKKDYKEIVLLGQNVNSYGIKHENETNTNTKLTKNINFAKLLRMVNDLPGNFWLTFISSHPKDLSDELIETMAQCEKLMLYLHLPVQAGNDEVLRRMNRHYIVAHYKRLIRNIRDKISMISVSTDIIVGFPGETKKQFADTAKLMREIKFDMAYLAKYSPRPGTTAWHLPDNVSAQEKEKRWQTLSEILKKTALENNKKYLGKIIEVLITESRVVNDELRMFLGQTRTFKNVKIIRESTRIKSQMPRIGEVVKVKITKVIPWGLEGIL